MLIVGKEIMDLASQYFSVDFDYSENVVTLLQNVAEPVWKSRQAMRMSKKLPVFILTDA